MNIDIERLETMPARISMQKSNLKIHGEKGDGTFRRVGHSCHKDWRVYGSHSSDMRRIRRQARALMRRD